MKHLSLLALLATLLLTSARADVPVIDSTSIGVQQLQQQQLTTQTNVLQQILQLNQQMLNVQQQLSQGMGQLNDPSNLTSALSGNFSNMTGSMLGGVSNMFGGNFSSLSGLMSDFTKPLAGVMGNSSGLLSFGQQISGFFGGNSNGLNVNQLTGMVGNLPGASSLSGMTSGGQQLLSTGQSLASGNVNTGQIAGILGQFNTSDRANYWGTQNSQVQAQTLANTPQNMQNMNTTLQRGTQDRTVIGKLQTANELQAQTGAALNEQNASIATAAAAEQAQNNSTQLRNNSSANGAQVTGENGVSTAGPDYTGTASSSTTSSSSSQ